MRTHGWITVLAVAVGCSEYKINATTDDAASGEETPEEEPEAPQPEEAPGDTAEPCTEVVTAFDIEELSTLQDAFSPAMTLDPRVSSFVQPWVRDALALRFDTPALEEDATWQLSAVDVLVTYPNDEFAAYPDGELLTVEIFEGSDPRVGRSWSVTQPVYSDTLEWDDYALPFDSALAGTLGDYLQKGAWLRFDLTDEIGAEDLSPDNIVVGVRWEPLSRVAVGYSNFNRACDQNWTEYAAGSGWVLNSVTDDGSGCSWPMMRVELSSSYTDDCE